MKQESSLVQQHLQQMTQIQALPQPYEFVHTLCNGRTLALPLSTSPNRLGHENMHANHTD